MRRFVGGVLLLLGVVGVLGSIAGIAGSWMGYQKASKALTTTAERVDGLFVRSTLLLDQVGASLTRAQGELDGLQQTEQAARAEPTQDSFLRRQTARVAAQQLGGNLDEAQRAVTQVTEAAVVLNSLLDGARELELEGIVPVDTAQTEELAGRLTTVIDRSRSVNARLAQLQPQEHAPEDVQAQASQAREAVVRVAETVSGVRARVVQTREQTAELHARSQFWLFWGTVAATVLLVWVALGQWCLMVQGWRWLRRQPPLTA